jgi:uncharacterized membrane protein YgdD (TMEM256/DUF423 family)
MKKWSTAGALMLALAVMLGAFGAHALKARFDAYAMGIWEKAVFYHFLHAMGLLVVPLFARTGMIPETSAARISALLLAGIAFFSGSLYALALTGTTILGAVTPIGGLCFIAAWLWLTVSLTRTKLPRT